MKHIISFKLACFLVGILATLFLPFGPVVVLYDKYLNKGYAENKYTTFWKELKDNTTTFFKIAMLCFAGVLWIKSTTEFLEKYDKLLED